jgi:hypothetical protein
MRAAVFAARQVPKHVIYAALDGLHGQHGLHVVGWAQNNGGAAAIDWAGSRPGAEVSSISSVRASDTRWMGQYFDSRAAVIACFKLHAPDRCLIFSSPYWIASGVGHMICSQAEKWSVPVHLYQPKHRHSDTAARTELWPDPPEPQEIELCHKKSVTGRLVCTRFKGHPSAWHWSMRKGERVSKFWLP